jgi:hypothetical protein
MRLPAIGIAYRHCQTRPIDPPSGRSNFGGRDRLQVCRRFSAISALLWRPHRFPRPQIWRMTFSVTLLRQRSAERM